MSYNKGSTVQLRAYGKYILFKHSEFFLDQLEETVLNDTLLLQLHFTEAFENSDCLSVPQEHCSSTVPVL